MRSSLTHFSCARCGALARLARDHPGGGLKVRPMVLPDVFLEHDAPAKQYDTARLNAPHIVARAIPRSVCWFANHWCFFGERRLAQGC